nr:TraR/DksA C4-type zinc finger protein [Brachybacterium fresconis]
MGGDRQNSGVARGRAAQLLSRRREVESRLQEIEDELTALRRTREGAADDDEHDPDGVPLSEQWSRLEGLRRARAGVLAGVDQAEARLERGEDGRCRRCGGAISPARLAARPEATTCIDCAF